MSTVRILNNAILWLTVVLVLFCGYGSVRAEESQSAMKDKIIGWVNKTRVEKGLPELTVDLRLNKAAKAHSENMVGHNLLSENDPSLGTPFERIRAAGLTDIDNLIVVAKASDWDDLRGQLESEVKIEKILSPEMTHIGVGIVSDKKGNYWVTLHMTERAITFTQFTLNQSTGDPVRRSIKINGKTIHEKVKALLIPPENSSSVAAERIVVPDSDGDFEISLSFGTATGNFSFEFFVSDGGGAYELKNYFSMDIH